MNATTTTAPESTMTIAAAALSAMTPVEVDTVLAALYNELDKIEARIENDLNAAHRAAGDKKRFIGRSRVGFWAMTDDEAVAGTAAAVAAAPSAAVYPITSFVALLADLADTRSAKAAKLAEIAVYADEFARRPWSRFFEVTSSDGHIHSSMHCHTCRPTTAFGWHPELSGLTEADAVAALGPILCSACFTSAPTSWTLSRSEVKAAADAASGLYCTGTAAVAGTIKWRNSPYGECSVCHEFQSVTSTGKVRKHKAPTAS